MGGSSTNCAQLSRAYCKKVDLKLDEDNKHVIVKECDIPQGYRFDKITCDDGDRSYFSDDMCDFKKAWVKIVMINKVVQKHHDDD